jgi:hypothetical protein
MTNQESGPGHFSFWAQGQGKGKETLSWFLLSSLSLARFLHRISSSCLQLYPEHLHLPTSGITSNVVSDGRQCLRCRNGDPGVLLMTISSPPVDVLDAHSYHSARSLYRMTTHPRLPQSPGLFFRSVFLIFQNLHVLAYRTVLMARSSPLSRTPTVVSHISPQFATIRGVFHPHHVRLRGTWNFYTKTRLVLGY